MPFFGSCDAAIGYSALGQKNNAVLRVAPKGSNRIIHDSALLEMRGHQNAKRTMHVLEHCAFAPYFWLMSTSQKKKTSGG